MMEAQLKYCSLTMSGYRYDYCYDALKREISTQEFPRIPIHKVTLDCGNSLDHNEVRALVEAKLSIPHFEQLEALF
jgi:hypothetical protein